MRVSENMSVQSFLRNVAAAREKHEKYSREVATGKKVNRPSDGPAESGRLVRIKGEVSQINQYYRNISKSDLLLGTTHDALNSLYNMTVRVMERSGYALSGTMDQDSLNAIATELRQVQEEMIRVAGTRIDGRQIFSGSAVQTEPLAPNGTSYDYQGDDQRLFIEIARGDLIQVNATGAETFSEPGTELINTLGALIDQLENGDLDGAKQSMDKIQLGTEAIEYARVRVGTNIKRLEDAKGRLDEQMLQLTEEVSKLEDADLSVSISNMIQAETGLRATLSVGSQLRKASLFDYLG